MTAFLRSLPPRRRTATLLGWGLLIASPFLLLAAVSLVTGRNAFATYPVWSDELDYWRNLFTWDAVGFHTGYNGMLEEFARVGTPNTWHSPTQLIAMVWMLICVPLTARCYDRFAAALPDPRANIPWREGALLGALLLVSLTAKPTFMQAFLPAACLFFLAAWVRHPHNSRFFLRVLACVMPAIAFMILQYMYYFGIIVPSQGDMVLEISLEKLGRVAMSTLLIQAFPLYVLVFFRKDGKRDTLFNLSLLMDIVGVAEYLLLGENGRRAAAVLAQQQVFGHTYNIHQQ